MRILAISNLGGGYADYMDIDPGTTVDKLFAKMVPSGKAEDYLVRVNRQPVARDYVLQEGDRVSITPLKVEGAALCPRPRNPQPRPRHSRPRNRHVRNAAFRGNPLILWPRTALGWRRPVSQAA